MNADNTMLLMLGSFHIRIEVVRFAKERGCKLVEMTGVGEMYCVANRRNMLCMQSTGLSNFTFNIV